MTARIDSDGVTAILGGIRALDEVVSEEDAGDTKKLAELLTRMKKDVAALQQQWRPRAIDFADVPLSSSAAVRLRHGFGGRVRYQVLDTSVGGGLSPVLATRSSTDDDTLELDAYAPVVLVLTSDFTTTSATAQSTALTFPVRDGERWLVEFWGFAGCSTADGMKYAIGAPSGSTIDGILDSSLGSSTTDARVAITAVNTLTSAVHTVAGGERDDYINARLTISGSGSVTIQVASTTGGDTTTLRDLACLRAMRMRTSVTSTATIRVEEAG